MTDINAVLQARRETTLDMITEIHQLRARVDELTQQLVVEVERRFDSNRRLLAEMKELRTQLIEAKENEQPPTTSV